MPLNKLFDTIQEARETAHWQAAFGEPQSAEGATIIPVARTTYGFGLGFGSGSSEPEAEGAAPVEGEGGGGGGGAMAKPLGVIVVTAETVSFQETLDSGKIAITAFLMGIIFILQLGKTLRAIFGRE